MERHRFACAVVVALGCAAVAAVARAQEPSRVALEWIAPEGCPAARTVEAEILRLAGHGPATPMRVRAAITREGERFRIELAMWSDGGEGSRVIEGATCEAIAEAGALVIAMAIDPEAALRAAGEIESESSGVAEAEPEPERAADSERAAEPEPVSEPTTAAEPAAESAAALSGAGAVAEDERGGTARAPGGSFLASARALLGIGPLPGPAAGAAIGLGVRLEPLELWVGASALSEQGALVDGFGASFWHASGLVRGCVPFALGSSLVELAPCAGVELGAIHGTPAAAVPRGTAGTSVWSALELVLDARAWIMRELGVSLSAGIEIPFVIERFVVVAAGDTHVLHRPADVAFAGTLGLVLRVP